MAAAAIVRETGDHVPWQISGRNEIDFHEWMKLDLKYIDNWSFGSI
jgi:lipopolysaccharide/colanic/teichoic acid biosynthesis glycosyltransferase